MLRPTRNISELTKLETDEDRAAWFEKTHEEFCQRMTPMTSPAKEIAALRKKLDEYIRQSKLKDARIAELEKEAEPKPVRWVPLKAAPRGAYSYNAVRIWANRGLVKTKRVGGRLFVDVTSMREFIAMRSSVTRG